MRSRLIFVSHEVRSESSGLGPGYYRLGGGRQPGLELERERDRESWELGSNLVDKKIILGRWTGTQCSAVYGEVR